MEQPLENLSEPQRARTPSQKQQFPKCSFGPTVPEPPNHPKRKGGISPSNSGYTGLSFFENTPKIVVAIFGVPLKQLKKGYIPSNKDRPISPQNPGSSMGPCLSPCRVHNAFECTMPLAFSRNAPPPPLVTAFRTTLSLSNCNDLKDERLM